MQKGVVFVIILFCLFTISADTLHVGASWNYKTPDEAAAAVKDGDFVLIDTGVYQNQATIWTASNITLKAPRLYAHLTPPSVISNQKAIWVIQGNNVSIENIEFSNASVPDKNGAGIRAEGTGLTIRGCYFHDNEDGILGGSGEILIEHSIFERNGFGDGQSHNLYISQSCTKLTFQYNYSHLAKVGHNLKSRAQQNFILYNRIMDEQEGTSSYIIDLPNGGTSFIIGNLLQQGPNAQNSTIITFGEEGLSNTGKDCYIVNNTIVNERSTAIFVNIAPLADTAQLVNNLFIGAGTILSGAGKQIHCLTGDSTDLVDMSNYDYHLRYGSDAIDVGGTPGIINGFNLKPIYEYKHPASAVAREQIDVIDIGAYENNSNVSITDAIGKNTGGAFVTQRKNQLIINYAGKSTGKISVQVFDLKGRMQVHKMYETGSGSCIITYRSLNLCSGVYLVKTGQGTRNEILYITNPQ